MGKGYSGKPTAGHSGYSGKPTAGRASNDGQRHSIATGQGIGQHRASGSGAPGMQRGQRGTLTPGANVGQKNGPAFNMTIGATRKDADIETTSLGGGFNPPGAKSGADDKY